MTAIMFVNVPAALRGMLDAFVSAWMRQTAAAYARQRRPTHRQSGVIAMSIKYPDLPNQQAPRGPANAVARDGRRAGPAPDQPATATTPFQPLDPGIVNASIPAFFIGRNKEGFWLARDVKGQIGGIFLLESSALAFARKNSRPSGCATIFPSERFELDLENQGNPLIAYLRPLLRLASRGLRRMAVVTGKIAWAVERRFRDIRVP